MSTEKNCSVVFCDIDIGVEYIVEFVVGVVLFVV